MTAPRIDLADVRDARRVEQAEDEREYGQGDPGVTQARDRAEDDNLAAFGWLR